MKTITLFTSMLMSLLTLTAASVHAEPKGPPAPVVKEVMVDAPPARVWDAWTTTAGVKTFFAPDLRIGGAYELYFVPTAPAGTRGSEGCKILSFLPRSMLSFSWNAPPKFPGLRGKKTWVVVELQPAGKGKTRVRVTHLGWKRGKNWHKVNAYFQRAWGVVTKRLQRRFKEGPVDWKKL